MSKWLLIDGFNLAYRCFHAVPELTRADGFPTNALHGWVKSLWKLEDQEKPDGTLVFFDLGGSQDRLVLLPEYKAQREEMPEALSKQIEPIKALTRAMGHVGVEIHGVESDDLLAAQAVALAKEGHDVLIVSSDKDFAQVVNERIKILLPPPSANPKLGWRFRDEAGVVEKFGVPPEQIADYLALVGDSSDNIPGISGVGPKTAVKWLQQYRDIEGVIANAAEIVPERFRDAVRDRADDLRRNLKLTTLNLSLPTIVAEKPKSNPEQLFVLLEGFEMKGSLNEARTRYGQPEFLF
ncbi:5'-3' exonuclease [Rariglobus hedericola]|uniref:5'-3' exonuclease n=1 Tax=Rariglobus hedericola TaxID=2597822 RepID=A0A556QQB7_9BACT|nr:5'-3' exonuclease H3TH domain-containing protein [Rariglobus hedericola]TSJ78834.1 5'-3' exonuclease [Rariglobus hedericola]